MDIGEESTMEGDGLYVEMDESSHEEYQENFADFMNNIQEHVKTLAAESSRAPKDAYEAFQGRNGEYIPSYYVISVSM